jgi:YebC/PmpR family DNA-binding regulatory protein
MSGHSKWSTIKHQKGAADAKRGQLFTKLTREIIVAAREHGSNPESNFRLRLAIQKARDNNMPYDNIERAIKRGSGETDGVGFAEMLLEGYGPGGTAIMMQALSDNRNRTLQEVRNLFSRHNSALGESGCVSWLFESRGLIRVDAHDIDAEEMELKAIDAGAEDIITEDTTIEIYTKPDQLEAIRAALTGQNVNIESSEVLLVPKTTVQPDEKSAIQTLKLLEKLEALDEMQSVVSNADFSSEVIAKFQAGEGA